jgi:molybdenum cofactor guanylyltransferase
MATATVTGALLAGGMSRRMGRDKRSIEVDGVAMARRAATALASVSNELLVVTAAARPTTPGLFRGLPVRLVLDERADAGPLAGLEAALRAARCDLVLVAAADMPWLASPVLRMLVRRLADAPDATGAVAITTERGPEPLLACYRRGVLPMVTLMLDAGERRMGALLVALATDEVAPGEWRAADPTGRSPRNINVPADLDVGA